MEKKNVLYKRLLYRWLCTMLLMLAGVVSTMANTQTFYYQAKASISPTGSGKVYVSDESTNNPAYATSSTKTGSQSTIGYGTVTLYFYAQANDGFIFDHWESEGETAGTSSSFNVNKEFTSTKKNSPTLFNYYAIFKAQTGMIKVKSADDSKGTVSISNPDNQINDEVTLTANPDASNGVMFLGWKKNNEGGEGEYYSTENPLVLTATTETEGTYWAYFSDAAEKVYIRLKNNKTGRFLSFYGNTKATSHTRDYDTYSNIKDGFIFTNSLKMISPADAQGNPSTVFLRNGHAQGSGVTVGADIVAHDTQYADLVGANTTTNKYMLTMEGSGSSVRIYTTYKLSVQGQSLDLPTYLCDEGGDFAVMKTIQGLSDEEKAAIDWTLYSLDVTTTEGAFGANAKAKYTKDGMYYTTMYTDFPYKLLDGVNAYYLVFNEEFTEIPDRVVFTQVDGSIVPANTAVILECQKVQNDITSTATVTNRLLPLLPGTEGTGQIVNEGANFIKGYVSVNGSTVTNDKDRMYVLSSKNDKLGFYHSTKDNMSPNKAYLLAPEATEEEKENYAKNVTFCFGYPDDFFDSEPTFIEMSNLMEDIHGTPIYDLLGRKVSEGDTESLPKGIYICNGKKFVIK